MRTTILIEGARENNLQGIRVEIPRDQLVVITGVSGSGKSSLAFDTLYAEGQRRLLESMSSYARRFVHQLKKPDVDFVHGLSPVISIDQKTISKNPRSTVGTMTDLFDYLRMLFATTGTPHCPLCEEEVPVVSPYRMMEHMLALPPGTEVEVRTPMLPIYGEDLDFLFEQIRLKGYRRARLDGKLVDLGDDVAVDDLGLDEGVGPQVEAIVDRFVVAPGIDKQVVTSLEHGLELGDGFLAFHIVTPGIDPSTAERFHRSFGCAPHRVVAGTMHHGAFTFNDPSGACRTCSGLGTYLRVHPPLLAPDPSRSLGEGAIIKAAFNHDKNSWGGRMLYSLSQHYGFPLDVPFEDLSEEAVDVLFYGSRDEKVEIVLPPGTQQGKEHAGKRLKFAGIVHQIESTYRWYRKRGTSREGMEDYLRKVMVEHHCPDCGGARLKKQRLLVTVAGRNLHQVGDLHLAELRDFLGDLELPGRHREVGEKILREISVRLDLLIEIGLDYLNLNRRAATLSGGESQRIRLSSQIGSGLMGMLYVLDEPSIGLHPKDNVKMIATLRRLRDLGNTVVVVEHDEDTIRAADHLVEIGPGPGVHGGQVVAQGSPAELLQHPESLTGRYLRGEAAIAVPPQRREGNGQHVRILGARHNNLKNLCVDLPLGVLVCVTGASGSGKSSLIHDILHKRLVSLLHDSRVLAGDHDALEGYEAVDDVIDIDQSPIGRSPRSNPVTYIGLYDHIRKLFASTTEAKERGFSAAHFSFNVKGGRCEECSGQGTILTQLSLMPDIEVTCPACKGARYQAEILDVPWRGKNIHQVLETPIEEGVEFFHDQKLIRRKLGVLHDLGLGYLKIGHPATLLSGGEAQRVKLASELGKVKRGKHHLYLLDEPTTGLHLADIQRLLDCLERLVDRGHTVVVIEHHLDVIKCADHVLDLGPEGGHKGGRVMAQGTPEEIAADMDSHTGSFLREVLERSPQRS